jgi:hypothetical protein
LVHHDASDTKKLLHQWNEESKADWVLLPKQGKEMWEAAARGKIERQPTIRNDILEALRANPSKSFDNIAEDIGYWCSSQTIQRWFASHDDYKLYTERPLPLLSTQQMKKHVDFSRHLRNNWGLPRQNILWIHYDEKWFYGWVCRTTAKKCAQLGIEKTHTYLYHKRHIEKVMAVAFTAFSFDRDIEKGGDGIKLGIYRVQGFTQDARPRFR